MFEGYYFFDGTFTLEDVFMIGSCVFMAAIVFIPKLRKMFF